MDYWIAVGEVYNVTLSFSFFLLAFLMFYIGRRGYKSGNRTGGVSTIICGIFFLIFGYYNTIVRFFVYPYNDTEIIVYCQSGSRSEQVSNILVANNFTKIFNMLGGINTWINAGYDYWLNENAPSIDIVIIVIFVSIIGIVAVLGLFYVRRLKVRKSD